MPATQQTSAADCARDRLSASRNRRECFGPFTLLLMASLLPPAACTLIDPPSASAKEKKAEKGESRPVTDTLIKVTTFTEIGGTLRGATVKLLPADKDGNPTKGKALRGVTNGMGEYPFHVPKTEATYVLQAEAKGFESVSKVVHARGEDQTDIFLQLPAKK